MDGFADHGRVTSPAPIGDSEDSRQGNHVDLVSGAAAPPMRLPADVRAMLVTEVDIATQPNVDLGGDVVRMAGTWLATGSKTDESHDGDLVVVLTVPDRPSPGREFDEQIDVQMLLAYRGRWRRVGLWSGVGTDWPRLLAPTAAAIMGLHTDVLEAGDVPHWRGSARGHEALMVSGSGKSAG
ncbi:hypothetical protein [Amycolatopsis sp. 195334CR]|uniref:hypothetical protein n=1 Tax=Amycolatopsis sp. 195334CR TaxID=2814588 RepID=UPI001A9001D7|nr:hypothetical protein [Amycolatopsis sp. 195334CR]MBN6034131.1 hypothetical protein [Amycolatopsis sp. 195334CR]